LGNNHVLVFSGVSLNGELPIHPLVPTRRPSSKGYCRFAYSAFPLAEFSEELRLPHEESSLTRIASETRTAGGDIIEAKGATYYGIGAALVRIIRAILRDGRAILTVSSRVPESFQLGEISLISPKHRRSARDCARTAGCAKSLRAEGARIVCRSRQKTYRELVPNNTDLASRHSPEHDAAAHVNEKQGATMKLGSVSTPLSGHLNPMTTLARRLQSRGNEVVFFGVPDVEPFARAAGLDFVPYGEAEYPVGSTDKVYSSVTTMRGFEVRHSCMDLNLTSPEWLRLPS
jgi:hypothetical protein